MRRTLPLLPLLFLLLTIGCATNGTLTANTGSPAEGSTEDFDVSIVQANTPVVMREQSTADLRFDITIANRTEEPYAIKRITLQSMSGANFTIAARTRPFDQTIAAGGKAQLTFWATARVWDLGSAKQPLTLRATLDAVSGSGAERSETFTARVNGNLQLQVARQPNAHPNFMQVKRQWIYDTDYKPNINGAYGLTW